MMHAYRVSIALLLVLMLPLPCVALEESSGESYFSKAIAFGKVHEVRELLDRSPELINRVIQEYDQSYPVHKAVSSNQLEVLALLIELGADVNVTDKFGETPLHDAAGFGYIEAARILLDEGADANALSEGEATPLIAAATNGRDDVFELLVRRGADPEVMTDWGATAQSEARAARIVARKSRYARILDILANISSYAPEPDALLADPEDEAALSAQGDGGDEEDADGYVLAALKIKLLAGDGKPDSVGKLKDRLAGMGYKVDRVDAAPNKFKQLTIFFNEGFSAAADDLAAKLDNGSSDEGSGVLKKPLTWKSSYDLIVVGGTP